MLASVTVLVDIDYPSDRKTIELDQERAGYYTTIVIDELKYRSALEGNDWTIPDDDEEVIRRLCKSCVMTKYEAREFLEFAKRHGTDGLRKALALARVIDPIICNNCGIYVPRGDRSEDRDTNKKLCHRCYRVLIEGEGSE